ncbi:hypothetical protein B0T16DRAFT_420574 [Cercophora newfieldiana]|uniref:Uncharacterized protein n=1 Tax=Cercophora newfieldiana TaxID=92897 RepID=A0AA39XZF9_9PEZI|nr:hypothetical protein B0T16DRAFT_420574 [Cercophora newfieldiana]
MRRGIPQPRIARSRGHAEPGPVGPQLLRASPVPHGPSVPEFRPQTPLNPTTSPPRPAHPS